MAIIIIPLFTVAELACITMNNVFHSFSAIKNIFKYKEQYIYKI